MNSIKSFLVVCLLAVGGLVAKHHLKEKTKQCPKTSFYSLKAKTIDGKEVAMSDYKGKYVLVVNVASKCHYTKQYEGLQELQKRYKNKLVVLGFPSNDFWQQEPGTNVEIKTFCTVNYKVTFPLFEKTAVIGDKRHPIYQWLTDPAQNGWNKQKPTWNFNKYLIDPQGNLIEVFGASTKPLAKSITNHLK